MKVAKLVEDAILPTVKHTGDAGMDFYSLEDYIIKPGKFQICRTGITVEIPHLVVGQLWAKSRNSWLVGAGVIDSNYQGEILVKIINPTPQDIVISRGDALAQMLFVFSTNPIIVEDKLENLHVQKTARGTTGGIVTELTNENS
jgi:dUTP pyrophosphatase